MSIAIVLLVVVPIEKRRTTFKKNKENISLSLLFIYALKLCSISCNIMYKCKGGEAYELLKFHGASTPLFKRSVNRLLFN